MKMAQEKQERGDDKDAMITTNVDVDAEADVNADDVEDHKADVDDTAFAEGLEMDVGEIEEGSDEEDTEDEDDDEEDGIIETNVDLGYCEPLNTDILKRLTRGYFPSKVGGVPAWLIPERLPSPNQFKCIRCGEWMTFLCQLYAPIRRSENSNAFHRTLYFFICQSLNCLKSENEIFKSPYITCLRSQLPLYNDYYPSNPPPKSTPTTPTPSNPSSLTSLTTDFYEQPTFPNVYLCTICGIPALSTCAACGIARYCSKEHQTAHWKSEHKLTCTRQKSTVSTTSFEENISTLSLNSKSQIDLYNPLEVSEPTRTLRQSLLFPVYSIVIEAEELDNGYDYQRENELLKDYEKRKQEELENGSKDDDDDDCDGLGRLAPREKDMQFRRFRKRVSANPSQIIRFERNGEPLWIQTAHQCSLKSVPPCEHCGSNRVFECQLMPQLLYYIANMSRDTPKSSTQTSLEAYLNAPSLDWGTIALYSCSASCTPSSTAYANEYIFVQPHYG
jgi:pre-rRNA-processing protein TSR4